GRGSTPGGGDSPPPGDGSKDLDEEGRLKEGFHGYTRGAALVDVQTGHVTLSQTESDLAVVFPLSLQNPHTNQEITIRLYAGLSMEVTLRRSLTKDAPKAEDVNALLPNQALTSRPLVGVGAPVVSAAPPSVIPERNTALTHEALDKVKKASV